MSYRTYNKYLNEVYTMIEELQIRNTALKILTFAYKNMQSDLSINKLDCTFLKLSQDDYTIIQKYLAGKNYIKTQSFYCNQLSFTLTVEGIDWVEENNNIHLG